MADRIAVIGATGYLGRAIVPRLVAAGHVVCAIARTAPATQPIGADFITCDATDPRQLAPALDGCRIIINLATGSAPVIECIAGNLAAMPQSRLVTRLIHLSSLAVFGASTGSFDENAAPAPHRGHRYAIAKLRAEHMLNCEAFRGRCVILRPGCIYGPGAPIWTDRIGRLILNGRLGNLGSAGTGIACLIHIDDMAAAVVDALQAPAHIYHVLGGDPICWNEYFDRFAEALGIGTLARIGFIAWSGESWLRSPVMVLRARVRGQPANIVTPVMRRLFASQARMLTIRKLSTQTRYARNVSDAMAELAPAFRTISDSRSWPMQAIEIGAAA